MAMTTRTTMDETRRRRGRKPVPADQQRRHPVTCRLTDAELVRVDAARGAVTRGAFLRRAALAAPPRVVPEVNRAAWVELARLSANLNQLARHLNEGRLGALPEWQPDELRAAVDRLRADLIGLDLDDGPDDGGCDEGED